MQTRQFGRTELQTTPIGFGAWAIGGTGWKAAWGPQDDNDSIGAIHRAIDLGINWIDTAAVYGIGHSEEVVGRAIGGRADRPLIFTKCGRVTDDAGNPTGNLKAESIRGECDASLRRLGLDVIDLYQIHWPQPDEDVEEAWTTLAELQAEGKVRHIGVSNFNVEQMRRAQSIAPIASLQPPYSLLRREIEDEILPFCQEHNIAVIVYSPMASGLLTGAMTAERARNLPSDDWRRNNPQFQEPRLSRNLQLVEQLRQIGERHGRSPGEVAIAWTLRHPAVTGAIVGSRRAEQVDGVAGAADFRLSDDEIAEIEEYLRAHP
jgi:aryl-alcohol dehydrogenase-like predicted oxidoreductase